MIQQWNINEAACRPWALLRPVIIGAAWACLAACDSGGAITSSVKSALGEPCSQDSSCATGICIEESRAGNGIAWTGGTCSRACSASNACPNGSNCVQFDDGSGLCLPRCSATERCRSGYVCADAVSACLPDCREGFDCGSSLTCDRSSGNCVVPLGNQGIGGKCKLNTDCTSSLCTPEQSANSNVQWKDGYCTQVCDARTNCADSATCLTYADGSSYCAAKCANASDCRDGYVCSAGTNVCLPDCRKGWNCGSTLVCDADTGACRGKMGKVGAACSSAIDCASGLCTQSQVANAGAAWKDGYCTQKCDSETACKDSSVCITYADNSAYCAAACSGNTDCRDGYVCSAGLNACLPDCRKGWDCGSTLICDADTGNCRGKQLSIGAPCSLDIDCASGICTPSQTDAAGTAWKDGYCTAECSASACPSGSTCLTYADASAYCVATCAAGTDCRSGYVCAKGINACLPDCREGWSCGSQLTCSSLDGTCR
jgi:hypothetical protein